MGVVFQAEDIRLGRLVAVKCISERLEQDPVALARFQREAHAISSLNHPNICTLYDIGEYEGCPFLVLEYLEGRTLRDRLGEGPLRLNELVPLAIEIGEALTTAHAKGLV